MDKEIREVMGMVKKSDITWIVLRYTIAHYKTLFFQRFGRLKNVPYLCNRFTGGSLNS